MRKIRFFAWLHYGQFNDDNLKDVHLFDFLSCFIIFPLDLITSKASSSNNIKGRERVGCQQQSILMYI